MKYCLFAFLDILGYSEFIESDKNNESIALAEAFKQLITNKNFPKETGIKAINFADTVIVYKTVNFSPNEFISQSDNKKFMENAPLFFPLMVFIKMVSDFYLYKGIPIRGSITIDKFYHDEEQEIYTGPALSRGHKLEKVAKYPRVILDPRLNKMFAFLGVNAFFDRDFDGLFSIKHFELPNFDELNTFRGIITRKLRELEDFAKIDSIENYSKWFYLARKYNDKIKQIKLSYSAFGEQPKEIPDEILVFGEYAQNGKDVDKSLYY